MFTRRTLIRLLILVTVTSAAGLTIVPHASAQYTIYDLQIPVPGDTWLAADLHTPDINQEFPIIFIQTPYNKNKYRVQPLPFYSDEIAWVVMDWRGFYGSSHADVPIPFYGEDGAVAIDWMAEQPWCNGRVGTYGGSALAAIQYMTAQYRPEHLVCCVPINHALQIRYLKYYHAGVMRTEFVQGLGSWQPLSIFVDRHPYFDWFWIFTEHLSDYSHRVNAPMLVITGWWDMTPDEALLTYQDLRERTDISVRDEHKLLIGPWTHTSVDHVNQGAWTFPAAEHVAKQEAIDFFNHWLLQDPSQNYERAPVRYFDLGTDDFVDAMNWPPAGNVERHLYLNGESLTRTPPEVADSTRVFEYDPQLPVPTLAGRVSIHPLAGPNNIHWLDLHPNIIVYESEILTEAVEIRGYIEANIFASTDRLDTDVSVILADVFPNGEARFLTDGIRRMRFRGGFRDELPVTPGTIYELEIPMQSMSVTFFPGHKIRLYVSGSNYPRFDRNLNNGGEMYVEGDTLVSTTTIYQNADYPSSLVFASPQVNGPGLMSEDPAEVAMQSDPGISISTYPNPFNAVSTLTVSLTQQSWLRVELFNIAGQRVGVIGEGTFSPGTHEFTVDGSKLTSGVYFIRTLSPVGGSNVHKLMLLK